MREGVLPTLGVLDGPPISICPQQKAQELDAKLGSQALLKAIVRAGVRP